jgi:nucleoside-diphosphate-sugar epimerase
MTTTASRIYVTGAAGMIGTNLCRALFDAGHEVVGVDNLWRGTQRNLEQLKAFGDFSFRHADIIADQDWYSDMGPDSVLIHTADIVAGIDYIFNNEWRVFRKNILINTQIARVVNQFQPRQLIYLGTVCSYPQGLQRSVDTSMLDETLKLPADPESGYGWSKLIGEVEFTLAVKGTRTRLTVLDLHNVYGWPCIYADSTAQVIPALINRALESVDRKLVVWGDGTQGRAFLHVDDIVQGALKAIDYAGDEQAFMLGPDHCTTIGEVAQLIQSHQSIEIDEIVYDTSKPVGDIGRFANAELARRELGWDITVKFEEGLAELIDHIVDDRARYT